MLNEQQINFIEQDMKEKQITRVSTYFQKLIDNKIRRDEQGIEHILANSRETNKLVRVLLEMTDYNLKGNAHFIPTSVSKSDVLKEAQLAVKSDLAHLREIKLSKKSNV
jgi:hypothetical protein